MKTLNSFHSGGKAATIGGIGVLAIAAILLLSFAPFFSFAAGTTVAVQTSASSYTPIAAGGVQIPISGTVTPAPGVSGYAVTIEVTNLAGLYFVTSAAVNGTTGAFSYTLVTGPVSQNWVNGTYTVTAVYAQSVNSQAVSGSTTFQYGTGGSTTTTTSTSSSSSLTATTIISNVTYSSVTTVSSVVTSVTSVTSVTTIMSATTTTVSSGGSSTTALIVGIVAIVIAVIAGAIAAMALRKH